MCLEGFLFIASLHDITGYGFEFTQDSSLQQRHRVFLQTLKSNTKKVFLRIARVFLQLLTENLYGTHHGI